MKKFILASIALLFIAASSAEAAGNPKMGLNRWQDRAGWSSVDSLSWSNQNAPSKKDSLATTVQDTTTNEIDITGVNYVSFWVITSNWHRAAVSPLGGNAKFTFQVSPDLNTWISLATTYSQTIVATDTELVVLYDQQAAGDTVAGGGVSVSGRTVTAADMRKVKAGKFVRVIARPDNTTGDSLIVKAMITREWPMDLK